METVPAQFATRLRNLRLRAGVSQETLAHAANVHPNAVGLLERGEREPMLSTVLALAKALGVSPCELIEGIDPARDPD